MATTAAIAGIRDGAVKRLLTAAGQISEATGVAVPELPAWRDPGYNQAMTLDAIAAWAESIAALYAPAPAVNWTLAEAGHMATERGIDIENMSLDQIVSAIADFDAAAQLNAGETKSPEAERPYEDWLLDELKELAETRKINITKNMKKSDVISVLRHFDIGSREQPIELPQNELQQGNEGAG